METSSDKNGKQIISHLLNCDVHPVRTRFGIPICIIMNFALFLASDLGSGVSADIQFSDNGEVLTYETIITISIFSSVRELWKTKSYALAVLITVTSICWPYFKLILAFYSWVTPWKNARTREKLIEWVDALGKWSFVDIFVLIITMVAFQSTTELGFGREYFVLLNRPGR